MDCWQSLRGTGLLRPTSLPASPVMDLQTWHLQAVEADLLIGRRGRQGWDGSMFDESLLLVKTSPDSWWQWCIRKIQSLPDWARNTLMVTAPLLSDPLPVAQPAHHQPILSQDLV